MYCMYVVEWMDVCFEIWKIDLSRRAWLNDDVWLSAMVQKSEFTAVACSSLTAPSTAVDGPLQLPSQFESCPSPPSIPELSLVRRWSRDGPLAFGLCGGETSWRILQFTLVFVWNSASLEFYYIKNHPIMNNFKLLKIYVRQYLKEK